MARRSKILLFYTVSVFFILLNSYFLIEKDTLLLNLLPIAFALVLAAIFKMHLLLLAIAFFTPVSLPLSKLNPGLPFDMYLPTEPLLFGVLILFIFKLLENKGFEKQILRHQITIALWFYLGWMLISSLTSTLALVSLKSFLSKTWFLAAFYFLGIILFRKKKNIYRFVALYCGAFIIVIIYAWVRHFSFGFHNSQFAHFVMNPFYKDHTSYGAMLAFFIPFLTGISFFKGFKPATRMIAGLALIIFLIALVLSYSRAAWLSLVAGVMIWIVIKLKLKFRPLFLGTVTLLSIIIVFQNQILSYLESNDQESSANLATHISSMTNVTSDASNLERLNRWDCAFQMFEERPVFGWGPGTYMFQYAPYQLTRNRTIISTNSADRGSAHSEFLGPLAESGLPGMISFLVLAIIIIYTGVHVYSRAKDREIRMIVLSSIIGISTYLVHGLLNNFLDTDKASIPFWSFVAIIIVFDLHTKKLQSSASDLPT